MVITLVVGVVALAGGFGLGRVKNAAKLKAVSGLISKYEADAKADVKTVIADIKSKL